MITLLKEMKSNEIKRTSDDIKLIEELIDMMSTENNHISLILMI